MEYDSYYRNLVWLAEQEAIERERMKPEVLISYFEQVNGERKVLVRDGILSQEVVVGEIRKALVDGRVRLKWIEKDPPLFVHTTDDETGEFVEVLIPKALYDLILKDSKFYFEMTKTPLDALAGWFGGLMGAEAWGRFASKASVQEKAFLQGAVGELIREIVCQHLELLEKTS